MERETMKNHFVSITFNTHCNTEEIDSAVKNIFKKIKLSFWNVTNLNYTKKEGESEEKTKRNKTRQN